MDPKKAVITAENLAESAKLAALYEQKRALLGFSQAEFGAENGIGTQGAVSACLNGTMAISLKAAIGFAKGLRCSVADFSPRLAALTGAVSQTAVSAMLDELMQCQPEGGQCAGQSVFAATLAKLFDCLPNSDDVRGPAFMDCMQIIRAAGGISQGAPPVPAPLPAANLEKPS